VRVAGVLRRTENRMDGATSVAADRLVGLAGMAVLVPYGLVSSWEWMRLWSVGRLGEAGHYPRLFLGTFGVLNSGVIKKITQRLKRGAVSLAGWLRRPRALLAAFGFTWVHQVCLFTNVWLFLRGMDDPLRWWLIAGLWSLSYFITLMPFSIGGLGIREISITYIFQQIGGISVQSALTLAVLLRALDILASIPGAFFLPTLLSKIRDKDAN